MNWKTFHYGPGNSHRYASEQSYVRVDGKVTKWGDLNVTGTVEAQTRNVIINKTDIRKGATAAVMWTANASRPLSGYRAKENFTYTFYTARLVNVSTSSLNTTGLSLFLNGTWNVYNITSSFTLVTDSSGSVVKYNRDENAVALVTNAYGELKVSENRSNFTLGITGVDQLDGPVRSQRITTKMFNPFKISNDDTSTVVTKTEVSKFAACYGSSPGWGNYDQRMDYNFNYKIDLTDLTTAAANVDV
jgi:hypothetical protein